MARKTATSPRARTRSARASPSAVSPPTPSCRSRTVSSRPRTRRSTTAPSSGCGSIVFTICPGFFQPLEQEVGRALAHRRAQGHRRCAAREAGRDPRRHPRALGDRGVVSPRSSPITSQVFHHEHDALRLAAHRHRRLLRRPTSRAGTLAGNGRFGAYGTMLAAEGIVRLVATVALVVIGVRAPGVYGLALVLPADRRDAHLAARPEAPARARARPRPTPSSRRRSGICSSARCSARRSRTRAYITAVVLAKPSQDNLVGEFAAGILIARIPMLGFQAVQAALLPKLARLAGAGEDDRVPQGAAPDRDDRARGRASSVSSAASRSGTWSAELLFGSKFTLEQPRRRAARDRQRCLHLRAHARAGVDRVAAATRPPRCRGSRASSAVWSEPSSPTISSCGRSSASRSVRAAPRFRCWRASPSACGPASPMDAVEHLGTVGGHRVVRSAHRRDLTGHSARTLALREHRTSTRRPRRPRAPRRPPCSGWRGRSSGRRTCSWSPRPAPRACSPQAQPAFRTVDRVRVLLPGREQHLLHQRRDRRRGRPAPSHASAAGRSRRARSACSTAITGGIALAVARDRAVVRGALAARRS